MDPNDFQLRHLEETLAHIRDARQLILNIDAALALGAQLTLADIEAVRLLGISMQHWRPASKRE